MSRTRVWTIGAAALAALAVAAGAYAADKAEKKSDVVEVGPAFFQAPPTARPQPKAADLAMSASRLPAGARHDLGELTAAERENLQAPDRRAGSGLRPKKPAV